MAEFELRVNYIKDQYKKPNVNPLTDMDFDFMRQVIRAYKRDSRYFQTGENQKKIDEISEEDEDPFLTKLNNMVGRVMKFQDTFNGRQPRYIQNEKRKPTFKLESLVKNKKTLRNTLSK